MLGIKEKFVILFFGLIRPYKGVEYLIEAFEKLPEEILGNSRLLIVGEIWEDKDVVKKIGESKIREKITFINRYVPYLRASQSGVAHIAMSFGLPIIATKVGGLFESLSNYEGANFVEANAESIAKALQRIYEDQRRNFLAPAELKWENIAKKWIELIESLCEHI